MYKYITEQKDLDTVLNFVRNEKVFTIDTETKGTNKGD